MQISDNLFLSVSRIVNVRVTPDNLRSKMEAISSSGGITGKVKTDMLIEILLAIADLDKKSDANR